MEEVGSKMRVLVSNMIFVWEPTDEVKKWCEDNLVLRNPIYDQLAKMGKFDTIRWKHISETMKLYYTVRGKDALMIPFGCLYALWPLIKFGHVMHEFSDNNLRISNADLPTPMPLFDYQEDAISALLKAKGGVLCSGCGSGKTITAIELIKRIGKPFLWICGTKDLLRQAKDDFLDLYPNMDIGTITDGEVNMGKDGTISTVQTLVNVDKAIYEKEFPIVIVDECHRAASNTANMHMYQKVLNSIKARYKYGLTATPFRSDSLTNTIYMNLGMSPEGEFKPTYTVDRSRINAMTAQFVSVPTGMQWNNQFLNPDGTFEYSLLIDYLSKSDMRNAVISKTASDYAKEGRKIAILTMRVGQCSVLAESLSLNGIKAVAITGQSTDAQRKLALENTDSWQIIVSTMSLFKEGLDIKQLDTVIIAEPVKDKAGIIQACGRCERKIEGKKQPLFVAMCDEKISYCAASVKKMKSYIDNR